MKYLVGTHFLTVSLATTSYHTMPYHARTETRRYVALAAQLIGRLNYRYVNYVRFTMLSFLVFRPLFLDKGSAYRFNSWDNHCPRTFSNTLMHVLITNIEIIFLEF